ncbi:MAG: hypothetical protein IKR84_03265 [Oscillibacter sp.]|nr:hypothetical protein [Oscillibacter sp.]
MKELTELLKKTMRLLYEAFMSLEKAASEVIATISNTFSAVFKTIPQREKNPDIPCRNWTRPHNQKVRPLMLDRRNRIFHCRNAI